MEKNSKIIELSFNLLKNNSSKLFSSNFNKISPIKNTNTNTMNNNKKNILLNNLQNKQFYKDINNKSLKTNNLSRFNTISSISEKIGNQYIEDLNYNKDFNYNPRFLKANFYGNFLSENINYSLEKHKIKKRSYIKIDNPSISFKKIKYRKSNINKLISDIDKRFPNNQSKYNTLNDLNLDSKCIYKPKTNKFINKKTNNDNECKIFNQKIKNDLSSDYYTDIKNKEQKKKFNIKNNNILISNYNSGLGKKMNVDNTFSNINITEERDKAEIVGSQNLSHIVKYKNNILNNKDISDNSLSIIADDLTKTLQSDENNSLNRQETTPSLSNYKINKNKLKINNYHIQKKIKYEIKPINHIIINNFSISPLTEINNKLEKDINYNVFLMDKSNNKSKSAFSNITSFKSPNQLIKEKKIDNYKRNIFDKNYIKTQNITINLNCDKNNNNNTINIPYKTNKKNNLIIKNIDNNFNSKKLNESKISNKNKFIKCKNKCIKINQKINDNIQKITNSTSGELFPLQLLDSNKKKLNIKTHSKEQNKQINNNLQKFEKKNLFKSKNSFYKSKKLVNINDKLTPNKNNDNNDTQTTKKKSKYDKNLDEFNNDYSLTYTNTNTNTNINESKNNILNKVAKHVSFNPNNNLFIEYGKDDLITQSYITNQKGEKYNYKEKDMNEYKNELKKIKPKSILKPFSPKDIKVNKDYTLVENLPEKKILPGFYDDFDDLISLESSLERSIDKILH